MIGQKGCAAKISVVFDALTAAAEGTAPKHSDTNVTTIGAESETATLLRVI